MHQDWHYLRQKETSDSEPYTLEGSSCHSGHCLSCLTTVKAEINQEQLRSMPRQVIFNAREGGTGRGGHGGNIPDVCRRPGCWVTVFWASELDNPGPELLAGNWVETAHWPHKGVASVTAKHSLDFFKDLYVQITSLIQMVLIVLQAQGTVVCDQLTHMHVNTWRMHDVCQEDNYPKRC